MSTAWRVAFAIAFVAVVIAAAATWIEVFDRLRAADPVPSRGTPAAIVWSERVFRSEAELAAWLRRRGINYARWVRTHPAAVSILRSRERVAAEALRGENRSGRAKAAARTATSPQRPSSARAIAGPMIGTPVLVAIGVAALALLFALGVAVGSSLSLAPISRVARLRQRRRPDLSSRRRLRIARWPEWSLRPRRTLAGAAASPSVAEHVVDNLARHVVNNLARAAATRPRPSPAVADPDPHVPSPTDAEKLKAQARQAQFPKESPMPVAAVEALEGNVERRTPGEQQAPAPPKKHTPAPVAKAAPKESPMPVAAAEALEANVKRREPRESQAPAPGAKAAPKAKRATAAHSSGSAEDPALRSVPSERQPVARPAAVAEAGGESASELRSWRGYISSRVSPFRRWRRSDQPQTPEAASALRSLVESLEHNGWRVDGDGGDWFSVRLQAPDPRDDVGPSNSGR